MEECLWPRARFARSRRAADMMTSTQQLRWSNRLMTLLMLTQAPIGLDAKESFLFMDLQDVQGPWGLLQPRASKVTRNANFVPPCVIPTSCVLDTALLASSSRMSLIAGASAALLSARGCNAWPQAAPV